MRLVRLELCANASQANLPVQHSSLPMVYLSICIRAFISVQCWILFGKVDFWNIRVKFSRKSLEVLIIETCFFFPFFPSTHRNLSDHTMLLCLSSFLWWNCTGRPDDGFNMKSMIRVRRFMWCCSEKLLYAAWVFKEIWKDANSERQE